MAVTSRTRYWRTALLSCLAVGCVGFLLWTPQAGLEPSAAIATIAGFLISVAALVIAITQVWPSELPPVDRTAAAAALADNVRDQWIREVAARSVQAEGVILPVTWTIGSAQFTDPDQPDHPWRQRKRGRLKGDFATASAEIAEEYRRVANRRLVVLGEPGAGKTVMAILLTVGLLNRRFSDADPAPPSQENPVPVLLAASSWDPILESFDDWVVNAVALSHYNGDTRIPRMLLDSRLLLPVVDGLDEIPESARRTAVHRINRAIGVSRPIVVTCRATEYEDAIRGGAPVLLRSPVVRMERMRAAETIHYLRHVIDDPDREGWQRVFEELRDQPAGPLAQALSTPLMVSLLVAQYGRADSRPEELFEAAVRQTRHTVEDHLLDNMIVARFAESDAGRYDPRQAARWLTFLATYLHRHRERDLAWWRMSERLMPRLAVPAVGILFGLLLAMVVIAVTWRFPKVYTADKEALFVTGMVFGGLFAVLFTLTWYAVPTRMPGRLAWAPVGAWPRARRGLLTGFAIVMMPVIAALLATAAAQPVIDKFHYGFVRNAVAIGVVAAAVGCVLGIGLAADAWLSAPTERSSQPSPGAFLRHDRRSALAGAAAAALTVMVAVVPLMLLGASLGDWLGHAVARATHRSQPDGIRPFEVDPGTDGSITVTFVVGIGISIGALVLLTRAWPRFLLVRAYLAVRREQPWRLPAFLAEARARNLLRESGGMWQFYHIGLQQRLASRPAVDSLSTQARESPPLRHRLRALLSAGTAITILVALAAVVVEPSLRPAQIALSEAANDWAGEVYYSDSPYMRAWRSVALSRDGKLLVRYRSTEKKLDMWELDLTADTSKHESIEAPSGVLALALAVSEGKERIALSIPDGVYEYSRENPDEGWQKRVDRHASGLAYVNGTLMAIFGDRVDELVPPSPVGSASAFSAPGATVDEAADGLSTGFKLVGPITFMSDGTAKDFALAIDDEEGPDTIRVYSGSTLVEILEGCHTSNITAITYTRSSTNLVTGSSEGTVRSRARTSDECRRAPGPLIPTKIHQIAAIGLPDGDTDRLLLAGIRELDGRLQFVVEEWERS